MAETVSKCAKGALTPYTRLQRDALSVFESYNVAFTFLFLFSLVVYFKPGHEEPFFKKDLS